MGRDGITADKCVVGGILIQKRYPAARRWAIPISTVSEKDTGSATAAP
jgi:hypothetical protein